MLGSARCNFAVASLSQSIPHNFIKSISPSYGVMLLNDLVHVGDFQNTFFKMNNSMNPIMAIDNES